MSASNFKAACYAATRNLYGEMAAAAKSLLAHSDVDRIFFLAEDDELPFWLPDCIEVVNVSEQPFFSQDGPNFRNGWTWMVLMKVALHRLFPDLERILYLDVDTFCNADVSELWDLEAEGNWWFAGAIEPVKTEPDRPYINAGVMLENLAQLRRDGKGDELIRALNSRPFLYCEQDCIAELCQRGIIPLSSQYNANAFTLPCASPKIVHYAAVYRWPEKPLARAWRERSWETILEERRKKKDA